MNVPLKEQKQAGLSKYEFHPYLKENSPFSMNS
jgi:hypothetical protein